MLTTTHNKITRQRLTFIILAITTVLVGLLLAVMSVAAIKSDRFENEAISASQCMECSSFNDENLPHAGTPVLMAAGYTKPIESIRPGDMVKSYNQVTGKIENKRVTEVFKYDADEMIHIILSNGENISTTPSHLFRTESGWVEARDLQSQDILFNIDQRFVKIDNIYSQVLDSPISVYNFTVANNHNYYVITDNINAVLVHNDCNISKFQINNIDDFTKGYNSGNVTSGIGKAPTSGTANTVYVKVDNSGNIMSITYYDIHGLPSRRLDIVGKPHPCKDLGNQRVIPHIHDYKVNPNPKNGQWGLGKEETNSASKELVNAIINYFKGL